MDFKDEDVREELNEILKIIKSARENKPRLISDEFSTEELEQALERLDSDFLEDIHKIVDLELKGAYKDLDNILADL